MPLLNDQIFSWASGLFILVAVAVMVWRNSSLALEVRTIRDFPGIEGFVSILLLVLAFPVAKIAGHIADHFGLWEKVYAETFIMIVAVSFSIGLAISEVRKRGLLGNIFVLLTLAALVVLVCIAA